MWTFISYTHDSLAHKARVLELANRLRDDGIDCHLDQYEPAPPEGLYRWMINQIEGAAFVLVVCTEAYARRFLGREVPGVGLGVTWEGTIIAEELYRGGASNTKFIPILFSADDANHIPVVLRSTVSYRIDTEGGYASLLTRLLGQHGDAKGPVGGTRNGASRPISSSARQRSNIPAQLTPLIGREKETTAIRATLVRDDVRLFTLTGTGGTGKTRLALEVAAKVVDEFEDGVFLIPLMHATQEDMVVSSVARVLGVRESHGQPLFESLKEFLFDKHLLLVLDNFEQVIDAGPRINELLKAAARVKALVTSREVLRLDGEHAYQVPPLHLPDMSKRVSGLALAQYPAVELFVRRAVAVEPDFELTDAVAQDIAEICARLDGLPLAIELAAARVKMLPTSALLMLLSNSLNLLTGGPRDRPVHQQTIRATIEWSYNLLNAGQQRLLNRLSVFAGGCTLNAAEAICYSRGDLKTSSIDALASLLDKSLISQDTGAGEDRRFWMLEIVRQYALERLSESGEADEYRRRYAEHYLALAEAADPQLLGSEQVIWLRRLDAEHDNLRAALQWAREKGLHELALRLAGALSYFWWERGYLLREGSSLLEEALQPNVITSPAVRAKVLLGAGLLARTQNDPISAAKFYEESRELYRRAGDQDGIAWSALVLGSLAREQGDYQRAATLYEEAQGLWHELGAEGRVALIIRSMGIVAQKHGDNERAEALFQESLQMFKRLHIMDGAAWSLHELGNLYREGGDDSRALAYYRESLELFNQLGDKHGIAWSLHEIGNGGRRQGDFRRAVRLLGASAVLRHDLGAELQPNDRPAYVAELNELRSRLGQDVFAEAWAKGQVMPIEAAIADALKDGNSGTA